VTDAPAGATDRREESPTIGEVSRETVAGLLDPETTGAAQGAIDVTESFT
jgi:hypothetical protein